MANSTTKWHSFIGREISHFLHQCQSIAIVVNPDDGETVYVHMPYMMWGISWIEKKKEAFSKLAQRHQDRLFRVRAAHANAPPNVRAFLQRHLYQDDGSEKLCAEGRATPDEIKTIVQEAIHAQIVPVSRNRLYPDSADCRQWLKQYGIGVDCSGFVQQALIRLVKASCAFLGKTPDERDSCGVGWMTTHGFRRDILGTATERDSFGSVVTPRKARPGDVLVSQSHIRIVIDVEPCPDDALILHLAESTSAVDIPLGQVTAEADIGPRRIQVQYPQPDQPIARQVPLFRRLYDKTFAADEAESAYILGRFRKLELIYLTM